MEPEGVVDVLRRLHETLVPGGLVLDLRSILPSPRVESGGETLGKIDYSAWFERAERDAEALEVLVREGLLVPEQDFEHEIVVVYPSGPDLLTHADGWKLKRVPGSLGERLAALDRACRVRENCLARRLRKPR
jgi:hypothetical protein